MAALIWMSLPAQAADIVLVIDDLGHNYRRDARAVALPGPLTVAILPFAPHARSLAESAADSGKEVILHQPMQPTRTSAATETGTLTADMSAGEFVRTVHNAWANVPWAVGLNNHTGSALTQDRQAMARLMRELRSLGLYFLDSRTTPLTVAERTAKQWRVPVLKRDVFLDNELDTASLQRAFRRTVRIARRQGYAVVIAHPHRETVRFLEQALNNLPPDINLATVSDVLEQRQPELIALRQSPAFPHRSLGQ